MAEPVSVREFGAKGDGVTDDGPAFEAAIRSVPPGSAIHLFVPRTGKPYRVDRTVMEDGRHVSVTLDDGVEFAGAAKPPYYLGRSEQVRGSERVIYAQGDGGPERVVGTRTGLINNGSSATYGNFLQYDSFVGVPANRGGSDIADCQIGIWHNADKAGLLLNWRVAVSPETPPGSPLTWGICCAEFNPVNRGPDRGWHPAPGQPTHAGGINVVPDSGLFAGGRGTNVLYSYLANQNGGPRSYNLFLGGPDAIAPGGRGLHVSGETTPDPARRPLAPVEAGAGHWTTGLRTDAATIATGRALQMGANQHVAWVDGDGRTLSGFHNGAGDPEGRVSAPVGSLYTRRDGAPGRTLYVKEGGGDGPTGWAAK